MHALGSTGSMSDMIDGMEELCSQNAEAVRPGSAPSNTTIRHPDSIDREALAKLFISELCLVFLKKRQCANIHRKR